MTALMLNKVLFKMPVCFRAANRTGKRFVFPLGQSHKAEAVKSWAALILMAAADNKPGARGRRDLRSDVGLIAWLSIPS